MILVLISCSISLFTIMILFFRKKNKNPVQIPTWFLGSRKKNSFHKKKVFTKPPLFSLILVILATLLAGYIFFPKDQKNSESQNKDKTLIWVDPSLSASMSRLKDHFSPIDEAKKLKSYFTHIYGIRTDFRVREGKIQVETQIVNLNSQESLTNYFMNEVRKTPSPFQQSLDYNSLAKILQGEPQFQNSFGTFIAYSDGNERSLLGANLLRSYFKKGVLIKSKPFYESPITTQEIIPQNLLRNYSKDFEKEESDFALYQHENIEIPDYLRPNLFLEKYDFENDNRTILVQRQNKKSLPSIFVCSNYLPGFIDFDSFSSLRELALFFKSSFLELKCDFENSSENKILTYRKGALWIVPLTKQILNSMEVDSQLLTPKNFNSNFDSLVYIAPTQEENDSFVRESSIQLEDNLLPILIHLAPMPPTSEVAFLNKEDNLTYKGKFKPILNSTNGIPLGFKTTSLPFYYLRTNLSSPNKELSRSKKWIYFWLTVAKSVQQMDANIEFKELIDVNHLEEEIPYKNIAKYLNTKTLKFEPADLFTNGLYQLQNKKLIFLSNSFKVNNKYMSEVEFSSNFKSNTINEKTPDKNNLQVWKLYFAYILFFICLILLWAFQSKEMR